MHDDDNDDDDAMKIGFLSMILSSYAAVSSLYLLVMIHNKNKVYKIPALFGWHSISYSS